MSFDFDGFKENLYRTAVAAKETSQTVFSITKCKLKIVEIKAEIDDKLIQIGRIIYNKDESEAAKDNLDSLCSEIAELENDMRKVQDIIDDNLNRKECPECGAKTDKNFAFCPQCGYNFEI